MKLYHYSNKDLNILSVNNFGYNYFTKNDYKISPIKRLFFYTSPKNIENWFKSYKYLYIVNVNKQKLYDLTANKLNLNLSNIDKALRQIKKHGYIGISYNNTYNIVNLFVNIAPIVKKQIN